MKCASFAKGFILALALHAVGCVSIPREAPELSIELGNRISAIEDAHIVLLQRFFAQKRREIDRFLEEEWVPEFTQEFFSNPTIVKTWDLVAEEGKSEHLKFIGITGRKLQARIAKKRLELLLPLEDLEGYVEFQLRKEYAQAKSLNNSITSFLTDSAKVAENRDRYLDMIGVTDKKIGSLIQQTDEAVSGLLAGATSVQDRVNQTERYLELLRAIKDSVINKEP